MDSPVQVRRVRSNDPNTLGGLTDVLIDCVEGGASVGFMLPLPRAKAERFWIRIIGGVAAGERALLVAEDAAGAIVGTVQVVLALPENQPHRAEVAKLLVHRRARRSGVAAALMAGAEAVAASEGRTLLVLDTVTGSDAERLYARLGWQTCGRIPGYALWPAGGPCSTTIFYKSLPGDPAAVPDGKSLASGTMKQ